MNDIAGFLARASRQEPIDAVNRREAPQLWGSRLRERVEPSLAELVCTAVALLRASGFPAVPVSDAQGRQWPSVYILGALLPQVSLGSPASGIAVAEVVLDTSGRFVRNHPVHVMRGAQRLVPVNCPSLAHRYEQFILATRVSEEPYDQAMAMTRQGELLICDGSSRIVTLAEYLNNLCRSAVGRTPGL